MFCVPFLGSESLSPEPCSRFYAGLEVTAFISAPTCKIDVGKLASKRQCNHILTIQQESLASLSWVAGTWHGGAKGPVAEQVFNGLKSPSKSLDAAKQPPKGPKIQYLAGSKSSSMNSSRLKPTVRNFEQQLAVLERIHLQLQGPSNSTAMYEEAQVTHNLEISLVQQRGNHHASVSSESMNEELESPHPSVQQSLEKQINSFNPSDLHVDRNQTGSVHSELSVGAKITGQKSAWNKLFLRDDGAQLSKNKAVGPPVGGNEQMSHEHEHLRIRGSYHSNGIMGLESIAEKDDVQEKAQELDACQRGGHLQESIQHPDNEGSCTWAKGSVNGSHSLIRSSQDGHSDPDAQFSVCMDGMSAKQFCLEKQGNGIECANVADTIAVDGKQSQESVDTSSTSCKVASVRMPVYRMATPLQRSLSDSIFFLESLGVDCSRLFRDDPTVMKCTVKQLRALVCALERYGLKSNDFGRIFNLCPKIVHLTPDSDLKNVTSFLFDEVGLARKHFGKVIRRCPRLLVADIQAQLRPTLSFLRNLGYVKMGQVISNNPTLLSFSVGRKLMPKLKFLESLGFSYREAASMVVRFPAIFNYSVVENLQPKYDYLVHEMGGRNKDLLAFPQYFGYSLETRIRPRYQCIARLDVSLSIQAILKLSDVEFNARFLSSGEEESPGPRSASPERSGAVLQSCSLNSVPSASVEHSRLRALVSV